MDSTESTIGAGAPPESSASASGPKDAIDKLRRWIGGGKGTPPPPPPSGEEEDPEEQGMLRMSFLEHLEELRTRIIRALIGIAVAFGVSFLFSDQLWNIIKQPAVA